MTLIPILEAKYPKELVAALLQAYTEIDTAFALGKWKLSELDAGHLVEVARRIIEHALFATYTPLSQELPKFSDKEVQRYEQGKGDESYRILLPRVLRSIYFIRNKRGVGHVGAISPNKMDATYILHSAKWIVAELVRLASGVDTNKAQEAIDQIVERKIPIVWQGPVSARVLQTRMPAKQQILVLAYGKKSVTADELRSSTEYSNITQFRGILKTLHKARLLECEIDGTCTITPNGIAEVERILASVEAA
jgi:hypothetical protein